MSRYNSRSYRWITASAVLLNIVFNYVYTRILPGPTIADISARYHTLVTPAGIAFSIWGLIYLGQLAYVIYQLLPAQRDKKALDVLNPLLILSSLLGMAWIQVFRLEWMTLSVVLIFAMLFNALYAMHVAHVMFRSAAYPRWIRLPFGLLAGWLSVAAIVNTASYLVWTGFEGAFINARQWTLLILLAALIQALLVLFRWRDYIYPLAVSWACFWIWQELRGDFSELAYMPMACAIILLLLTALLFFRRPTVRPLAKSL